MYKHALPRKVYLKCQVMRTWVSSMEQRALKNCLNTNIYPYLETSGGQSSNQYLNVVHFFNTSVK